MKKETLLIYFFFGVHLELLGAHHCGAHGFVLCCLSKFLDLPPTQDARHKCRISLGFWTKNVIILVVIGTEWGVYPMHSLVVVLPTHLTKIERVYLPQKME